MYVNGTYICDTIEDCDRGLDDSMSTATVKSKKVYGETAIPTGIYEITMNVVSPKFKSKSWAKPFDGKLPRLLNVKGYDGVLIHVMNKASESLGCIGVGYNTVKGMVTNSTSAFNKLMNDYLLKSKDKISITIRRKYSI
jgi:hypothetical protein